MQEDVFQRVLHSTPCGPKDGIFTHESRTTNDSGIMGNFDTSTEEVWYCGTIERIIKVNCRTFHTYVLECYWFSGVAKRHENGLYMVDSTQFYRGKTDDLIHPSSCEQVMII